MTCWPKIYSLRQKINVFLSQGRIYVFYITLFIQETFSISDKKWFFFFKSGEGVAIIATNLKSQFNKHILNGPNLKKIKVKHQQWLFLFNLIINCELQQLKWLVFVVLSVNQAVKMSRKNITCLFWIACSSVFCLCQHLQWKYTQHQNLSFFFFSPPLMLISNFVSFGLCLFFC